MKFTEADIKGVFIIDMQLLQDERGFFSRSFCKNEFEAHGLKGDIVQTNVSFNAKKGTLRGIHMQQEPYSETKIVRCSRGSIYDVVIDMRPASATYMQWFGMNLKADDHRMIYIPENFAHGFITLEDNTEVTYLHTEFYTPGHEKGFRWNDPAFNINWPIEPLVMAEKDKHHSLVQTEKTG